MLLFDRFDLEMLRPVGYPARPSLSQSPEISTSETRLTSRRISYEPKFDLDRKCLERSETLAVHDCLKDLLTSTLKKMRPVGYPARQK